MPSKIVNGSTTFPLDLLIFWPARSHTSPCRTTSLKGSWPDSSRPSMTMRATQKKRISTPVSSAVLGKKAARSGLWATGQPRAENGRRAEENQVSSTSSSCSHSSLCVEERNFSILCFTGKVKALFQMKRFALIHQ